MCSLVATCQYDITVGAYGTYGGGKVGGYIKIDPAFAQQKK